MGRPAYSGTTVVTRIDETSVIGQGSAYGTVTVGMSAVELKAGAVAVVGRTAVFCMADAANTGYVYLGLDNAVSTTRAMAVLQAGQGVEFQLDGDQAQLLYAYASATAQKLHLVEVKK